MHTLTFIAKGFENWTILIFYFDNLILSNLKQMYCLFTCWLFNPRSSKYQFSKCKLMFLMSMPYLYIKKINVKFSIGHGFTQVYFWVISFFPHWAVMEIYDLKTSRILMDKSHKWSLKLWYYYISNLKCLKECTYTINIYNAIGIKIARSKLNHLNICIN